LEARRSRSEIRYVTVTYAAMRKRPDDAVLGGFNEIVVDVAATPASNAVGSSH
jgi:hypothetical protein